MLAAIISATGIARFISPHTRPTTVYTPTLQGYRPGHHHIIVYSLPIQNTTSTAYPAYPTAHCVNPYLAKLYTRPGHCYVMRPPNTSDCPNCCPALHLSMVEARKLPPKYHLSPVLPSDDEQAGSIFVGYTHKCLSINNSVQTSKHVLVT